MKHLILWTAAAPDIQYFICLLHNSYILHSYHSPLVNNAYQLGMRATGMLYLILLYALPVIIPRPCPPQKIQPIKLCHRIWMWRADSSGVPISIHRSRADLSTILTSSTNTPTFKYCQQDTRVLRRNLSKAHHRFLITPSYS